MTTQTLNYASKSMQRVNVKHLERVLADVDAWSHKSRH